ncbi:MAG: 7-dehydrocholesterol reductase [Rhabdochlamydiaceae bacterium]|nr:7-dehydrocholesterol reductase [Rhabdochlamydiaceae bacterium]
MSATALGLGNLKKWIRHVIGPFLLITCCPPIVMLVWYTNVSLGGSIQNLWNLFQEQGMFTAIYNIWAPVFFGTPIAWKILGIFAGTELLLMKALPGRRFEGPITPKGNVPVYKANGISAFLTTMGLFYVCSHYFHLFSPTIIYDNFGALLGALNVFSLIFCLFLYFKGRYKPSSTDSGKTGDAIFDYFWGMELYPRIFGWDVKMFTNCRFGMMGWGLILLSYASKQSQLYGLTDSMIVGVSLQLLYIAKFFWWETGYLRSMDIMHDRAGFCICWGCMVWLPCIYTSPTLYLVNQPNHLGTPLALFIFAVGAGCIFINYLADRQRQYVRLKNGDCTIWKKKPELIFANYKTDWGEEKQSVLLVSGWWGISRHFHYIPEILGAFCWSVPALFTHFLPYFYLLFLVLLLLDRAFRQERRCAHKYGDGWKKYCERVPFRLIPFLY